MLGLESYAPGNRIKRVVVPQRDHGTWVEPSYIDTDRIPRLQHMESWDFFIFSYAKYGNSEIGYMEQTSAPL